MSAITTSLKELIQRSELHDPPVAKALCNMQQQIESLEAEKLKLQDIIKDRDAQIVEIGARLEYLQEALK